jgi:hypothetical protein
VHSFAFLGKDATSQYSLEFIDVDDHKTCQSNTNWGYWAQKPKWINSPLHSVRSVSCNCDTAACSGRSFNISGMPELGHSQCSWSKPFAAQSLALWYPMQRSHGSSTGAFADRLANTPVADFPTSSGPQYVSRAVWQQFERWMCSGVCDRCGACLEPLFLAPAVARRTGDSAIRFNGAPER